MGARLCLSRFTAGAEVIESHDHYETLRLQDFRNGFITEERRCNDMTMFTACGPPADKTEDFWDEIIERRIPTVFMTCEFFRNGVRVCAQYIPKSNEHTRQCGVYTVQRIGPPSTLNAKLSRQQLLVYRTDDVSGYKHKVMHFQQTKPVDEDDEGNYYSVAKAVSHQPNPQVLFHGEWAC